MRPHLRSRERHVPVIRFLSSEAERLRTAALPDLLRWMLTTGQKECSGLGYPPKEIADRELRETTAPRPQPAKSLLWDRGVPLPPFREPPLAKSLLLTAPR